MKDPREPREGESLNAFMARSAVNALFYTALPIIGIGLGLWGGTPHGNALAAMCAAVLFVNRTEAR